MASWLTNRHGKQFELTIEDIITLLSNIGININETELEIVSEGYSPKLILLIAEKYVLKIAAPAESHYLIQEHVCIQKLPQSPFIAQIVAHGQIKNYEYLLLTKLPGNTAFRYWRLMKPTEQNALMQKLSVYFHLLHAVPQSSYVIGHHQHALYGWSGTWQSGHDVHVRELVKKCLTMDLPFSVKTLITQAESFYKTHRDALSFQDGPKLCHGDFNLHNTLVENNALSGIIDWEMGGGSEIDHEFVQLIGNVIFPAHPADEDIEELVTSAEYISSLRLLFQYYPELLHIPHFWQRITIYLIEADLHKIAQSGHYKQASERLDSWLNTDTISQLAIQFTTK